jgi:tripartite-type tricarboxylate transporter receptor subunit TctC
MKWTFFKQLKDRFAHQMFLLILFVLCGNTHYALAAEVAWPNKPIKMLIGFAPGGGSDIVARLMAKELGERLGQSVVVDNRPGAGGNIASEMTAKAAPDGYTILFISSAHSSSSAMKKDLPFKPVDDFTWLSLVVTYPLVVLTSSNNDIKTFDDFVTKAKASPGKYSFSSSGVGTAMHIVGQWIMSEAGLDVIHVPFKGGTAPITELMAGRVDLMVDTMPLSAGIIKDGRAIGLGATAPKGVVSAFNIPAIENTLSGVEFLSWLGIAAPVNMPPAIRDRLNKEINYILSKPDVRQRLIDLGTTPSGTSPDEFKSLVVNNIAFFNKVMSKEKISKN